MNYELKNMVIVEPEEDLAAGESNSLIQIDSESHHNDNLII
jgi:hypothetical protein